MVWAREAWDDGWGKVRAYTDAMPTGSGLEND